MVAPFLDVPFGAVVSDLVRQGLAILKKLHDAEMLMTREELLAMHPPPKWWDNFGDCRDRGWRNGAGKQ